MLPVLRLWLAYAVVCSMAAAQTEPLPRRESNVSLRNEVQLAIDKGLARLEATQRDDGTWGQLGETGFALMAFQRDPRRRYLAGSSAAVMPKGYAALQKALGENLAALEDRAWNIPPAWIALHAGGDPRYAAAAERGRQALKGAPPKEMEKLALYLVATGGIAQALPPLPAASAPPLSGSALAALIFVRAGKANPLAGSPEFIKATERLGTIYTLERNPGGEGVHQYYFWLSAALRALTLAELPLPDGRKVDVARQLAEKLINEQNSNGAWPSIGDYWSEKDPDLVTSHCLLTLEAVYFLL